MGHRESLYLDRDDSDLGKTFVKLHTMLRNEFSDGLGIVAVET